MSKVSFLRRKSNIAADEVRSPPAAESNVVELDPELFGPAASRLGEENEAVRSLLANAESKIGELDAIKDAFGKLVDPVNKALTAFEAEKNERFKLQALFNKARSAYGKLRTEFGVVHAKVATLESDLAR